MTHDFNEQVRTLVAKGYPKAAGLSQREFRERLEPLRARVPTPKRSDGTRIPFVIVVPPVPPDLAIPLVEWEGRDGFTDMPADDLRRFAPTRGVRIPPGTAYLATDIDTGQETLNLTPDDAVETIRRRRRSPLTVEEGIALVTQYPDILRTHNSFSLAGSRCGDRRVPALWLSKRHPRLGWCWAGNPHSWLGSASCGARRGLPSR